MVIDDLHIHCSGVRPAETDPDPPGGVPMLLSNVSIPRHTNSYFTLGRCGRSGRRVPAALGGTAPPLNVRGGHATRQISRSLSPHHPRPRSVRSGRQEGPLPSPESLAAPIVGRLLAQESPPTHHLLECPGTEPAPL